MSAEPVPQPDRRRWLLASAAAALLPPRALSGEAPSLALLRRRLPVVCRHEGVWEGVYRRYDAAGKPLGEHRSRVVIRLRDDPKGGADLLHQSNHYYHPDGRRETLETYGSFDGERLNFYSDRVDGWTMDDGTDPKRNTVILGMTFKKDAGWYRKGVDVYEIINIATDGRHRARMAQHLQDGQALSRTLIDERLRTREWRAEADWQVVPFGEGA
jgi:hypothetical protein